MKLEIPEPNGILKWKRDILKEKRNFRKKRHFPEHKLYFIPGSQNLFCICECHSFSENCIFRFRISHFYFRRAFDSGISSFAFETRLCFIQNSVGECGFHFRMRFDLRFRWALCCRLPDRKVPSELVACAGSCMLSTSMQQDKNKQKTKQFKIAWWAANVPECVQIAPLDSG